MLLDFNFRLFLNLQPFVDVKGKIPWFRVQTPDIYCRLLPH